jgi:putative PIN family toxin of toxin-antitoxin system
MNGDPIRAVLDTVVVVQALISGMGPAAAVIEMLRDRQFTLLLSDDTLRELNDVPRRPELTNRFKQLTEERVSATLADLAGLAIQIPQPPKAFSLPRDPRDEPLIDLAVAGHADFLVTWNHRHLTYLMAGNTPEGIAFLQQFPFLRIVTPVDFLQTLRTPKQQ